MCSVLTYCGCSICQMQGRAELRPRRIFQTERGEVESLQILAVGLPSRLLLVLTVTVPKLGSRLGDNFDCCYLSLGWNVRLELQCAPSPLWQFGSIFAVSWAHLDRQYVCESLIILGPWHRPPTAEDDQLDQLPAKGSFYSIARQFWVCTDVLCEILSNRLLSLIF